MIGAAAVRLRRGFVLQLDEAVKEFDDNSSLRSV
jgi:hypothetical protein